MTSLFRASSGRAVAARRRRQAHQLDRFHPVGRPRRRGLRSAFTLIEILVVIVVIAILATLVAPNIFQHVGAAKSATAKSQVEILSAALDAYRLDTGTYPTTQQGLDALWTMPTVDPPSNWRGPYLRKPVPPDPWNRPYVYQFPGQQNPTGFDLLTYGEDGQPGGEGENADILSWK
jgi:general secretion pathway protein G